uniref:Uncharacterized protein n=1 Tax=Tanacetum cinerariifolium TaxID=118510 RepID=A0A6L2M6D3_TANCI|nr:hypothetical protein [Tanacetum cinerariifolium]
MRRIRKGFYRRITPLFPTMVVQSQLVEGSAMPTDPHYTLTVLQTSSSQPQKTHKPRKPTRKDDSLVRATTAASSLEAEQDSGNTDKTQSKATPNESSFQGTDLGGGPSCQKAMGDTIAQTRFENVSKLPNDLLLARGNALQSDKDRLKLNKLMELCTNLQTRVIDLEKTKTTQANEIDSLKRRIKQLKRRNKSRTHKLKRLYKVGLTTRVESSYTEESLGEDASKQGRRIDYIDADKDITLVNVQADAEMFHVDKDLGGEEVFVEQEVVADKEKIDENLMKNKDLQEKKLKKELEANIALIETWDDVQAKINDDYYLTERLQAEEQQELTDKEKATLFMQLLEKRRKFFTAKRVEDKRNKPPTQSQQRKIMCTYLKNVDGKKLKDLKNKSFDFIQEMFDRAFKRLNTFVDFRTKLVEGCSKRAREELIQESTKKQKLEDDKETAELKQLIEIILDEEEVVIDAIPLAVKSPRIVDWKIYKE